MKTIRCYLVALTAATFICTASFAATTGELLQQGLYAEEVEGNLDAAIKAYGQIIKNNNAPENHIAQALYRQGMCYLKIKDETAARASLERLVNQYPGQKDLVDKALPLLDELTDFDPATLMPPKTLAYVEFGSPGKQVETLLTMLKGTPFENPLAAMAEGDNGGSSEKTPGDIMGALLNPSMLAEFKKIRSSAIGVTEMVGNNAHIIGVLYPGKSDALRGLILAGIGMAGKPGKALEGMQTVNLPEDFSVAYDERVMIFANPASDLEWSVKKYKGVNSDPSLATSNKSFARLNKNQRQHNLLSLWLKVDQAYAAVKKIIPEGKLPPQIVTADLLLDLENIDDLTLTKSIETNGLASRIQIQFKKGHHCVAYDMIHTPNVTKAAMQGVPPEAVAVAAVAMNQAMPMQTEKVRTTLQNITGLDLGRELFSNIEQVTVYAVAGSNSDQPASLPGQFGLVLTSRDPQQTRRVLDTMLGSIHPVSADQPNRYQISQNDHPTYYCYVEQVEGLTLISLDRNVMAASVNAVKNRKSAAQSGPLSKTLSRLAPSTSKLLVGNAGGIMKLMAPLVRPDGLAEGQSARFDSAYQQLADAARQTTIELRTDEQPDLFAMNTAIVDLPPLTELLQPIGTISELADSATAANAGKKLPWETPALVLPTTKPPTIDGRVDEIWQNAPRYKLEHVAKAFASGEPASKPASPADLSANWRALWDENNLYLLVEVTDDKLVNDTSPTQAITVPSGSEVIPWWYDDAVEVYLDAANAKPEEYGEHDAHYHFDWDKTKPTLGLHNRTLNQDIINQTSPVDGVEFAMETTDKGYRTEIKFPWAKLHGKPAAGASIGIDVHVSDDDDGGPRDSKITWHDQEDIAYRSPRAFGTAELGGLLGWWKFDENNGTQASDSSAGNHPGFLTGNAKWAKGKVGGAIELDGNSFVRVPKSSGMNCGAAVTVAGWVKFRSVPADWTAIATKGDSAWRLSTVESNNQAHFAVNDPQQTGSDAKVNGQLNLDNNTWHHLTGTYDGKDLKVYVDGKRDQSAPWTGGLGRNEFEVLLGANVEREGRGFDGWLDDIRIYNYALPESEIKSLAAGQ